MAEWWTTLEWFERIFWIIAIPFTLIFIFQLALSFLGADADIEADFDGDLDGDIGDSDVGEGGAAFQLFTVRNFVTFLTVFGWSGIAFNGYMSKPLVVLLSMLLGFIAMLIVAGMFYFFGRMVESGNYDIRNAINKVGEVYLPIKADRGNIGKISVSIQGSLKELDAITDEDEDLSTGTVIQVIKIINTNILLVRKPK